MTHRRSRLSQRHRRLRLERLEHRRVLTAEVEPNDAMATATLLLAKDDVSGLLATESDRDFFKVDLQQGDKFTLLDINISPNYDVIALPQGFDFLDSTGSQLLGEYDGIRFSYTANQTSSYFVRVHPRSMFGTVVGSYTFKTEVNAFSGRTELEPNEAIASATPVTGGQVFRGAFSNFDSSDV